MGDRTLLIVSNSSVRAMVIVLAALLVVLDSAESVFAGGVPVPGPLVGAGLPGLAVLGCVYGAVLLARKLRDRKRTD